MIPEHISQDHDFEKFIPFRLKMGYDFKPFAYFKCKKCKINIAIGDDIWILGEENFSEEWGSEIFLGSSDSSKTMIIDDLLSCDQFIIKEIIE